MYNFKLNFCVILCIISVSPFAYGSWKPIAGPTPSDFTQSIGGSLQSASPSASQAHHQISNSGELSGAPSKHSGATVTYHGNAFLDEHLGGHSNLLLGDTLAGTGDGASEERILGGNKLYNDFYAEVST